MASKDSSKETLSTNFYSPLKEADEIRLLYLKPSPTPSSKYQNPILCRIEHVRVRESPEYEALSYMWGDATVSKQITVNNTPFLVRTNLFKALLALRYADKERVIWIDAVCINQRSIEERNHQVSQMRAIHRNAFQVVAWLGDPAFEMLPAFKILSEDGLKKDLTEGRMFSDEFEEFKMLSVLSLCRQEYWTRLWIRQEVVLGKNVLIQSGWYICTWESLAKFFESLRLNAISEPLGWKPVPIPQRFQSTTPWTLSIDRSIIETAQNSANIYGSIHLRPLLRLCVDYCWSTR